jgi:hypothetical protein
MVNWLSDAAMLPAAVPNARIFTYNWHADFYKDAVDLTLKNHAEGLLLDIRAMREEVKYNTYYGADCVAKCMIRKVIQEIGQLCSLPLALAGLC